MATLLTPSPAALAIVYPKAGRTLRVPLRHRRGSGTPRPEQQFMRWFRRMAAAQPGFPLQVKSLLLLTDEPLCAACRRTLARFLGQYQLAGRVRVQATGGAACPCGQLAPPPLLDDLLGGELAGELSQELTEVIHPNIDVHAQYALQRLIGSPDPGARVDGNELLAAVRMGRLRGIYIVNQQVPAQWARAHEGSWWEMLAPPDDAALFVAAPPPGYAQLSSPLLVFRESIRTQPRRLDPALRTAARLLRQIRQLKSENPALTPWQLKNRITGEPLPTEAPTPGSEMVAWFHITRAA